MNQAKRAMTADELFEYATTKQFISPSDARAALEVALSEYPDAYFETMSAVEHVHGFEVAIDRACEFGDFTRAAVILCRVELKVEVSRALIEKARASAKPTEET